MLGHGRSRAWALSGMGALGHGRSGSGMGPVARAWALSGMGAVAEDGRPGASFLASR